MRDLAKRYLYANNPWIRTVSWWFVTSIVLFIFLMLLYWVIDSWLGVPDLPTGLTAVLSFPGMFGASWVSQYLPANALYNIWTWNILVAPFSAMLWILPLTLVTSQSSKTKRAGQIVLGLLVFLIAAGACLVSGLFPMV